MSAPVQSATALYLHVPFCASSCDFCSFYQEQPKRGEIDRYLSAIEREMELHPPGRVETAFWGGGTPGLLPAEDLLRLGHAMTKAAGRPGEWTVELAPSSVRADKLAALKQIGYKGHLSAEIFPLPDARTAAMQTIESISSAL